MDALSVHEVRAVVRQALAEDIGSGDVTTDAVVPKDSQAHACLVAREALVVAGLVLAEATFKQRSPKLRLKRLANDGQWVRAGTILMTVQGSAQAILTAERVALNFVQRLSGIASLTARYVAAVQGTKARILDTRKTTPGLRRLEKYAVACGGGKNHRLGLHDLILIKYNHLAVLRKTQANAISVAIRNARLKYPNLKVEVEAETLEQVAQAVTAGADIILLDNMDVPTLRKAVKLVRRRAITEASGGVTLDDVRKIAQTGVDFISVGALTHSARAMDVALDFSD
jgi:nicotinate-nucleotide pyrophosphorylase (carboxylating)